MNFTHFTSENFIKKAKLLQMPRCTRCTCGPPVDHMFEDSLLLHLSFVYTNLIQTIQTKGTEPRRVIPARSLAWLLIGCATPKLCEKLDLGQLCAKQPCGVADRKQFPCGELCACGVATIVDGPLQCVYYWRFKQLRQRS